MQILEPVKMYTLKFDKPALCTLYNRVTELYFYLYTKDFGQTNGKDYYTH